jgi:hypothetical protein
MLSDHEVFALRDDYATREVDNEVIYVLLLVKMLIEMLTLTMMMIILTLMLVI